MIVEVNLFDSFSVCNSDFSLVNIFSYSKRTLQARINLSACTFHRQRIVQFINITCNLNSIGLTKLCSALRIKTVNGVVTRLKSYFGQNWGAPFVIAFIVLILLIAADLSFSLFSFAEELAVMAFIVLTIGVFLQVVCFVKYRNGSDGEVAV